MESPPQSCCPRCGRPLLRDPAHPGEATSCLYCGKDGDPSVQNPETLEGLPLPEAELVQPPAQAEPPVKSPTPPADTQAFLVEGKWLRFGCPNCRMPIRIRMREAAESLVDCSHCGLEVIPPDPDLDVPAQLTRASAAKIDQRWMEKLRFGKGGASLPTKRTRDAEFKPIFEEEENESPEVEEIEKEDLEDVEDAEVDEEEAEVDEEAEKELLRPIKPINDEQVSSAFREFDRTEIRDPNLWENDEVTEEEIELSGKPFPLTGVAMVMAGALVVGGWLLWTHSGNDEAMARLAAQEVAANAERNRFLAMAQEIVAREDWRAMIPDIRQPERVQPIMRHFYARKPHEPVKLLTTAEPAHVHVGNSHIWQAIAQDADGNSRFIAFEKRGEQWRLDWEAFVNMAHENWQAFKKERPASPTILRVIMTRCSPLQSELSDARLPRENALGVRLWQKNRTDSLVAIVEKDSFLGWQIEENVPWNAGALFIVEASYPIDSQARERVRIDRILQRRWLYGLGESGLKVEGGTATAARLP